jgi:hypothetical protein
MVGAACVGHMLKTLDAYNNSMLQSSHIFFLSFVNYILRGSASQSSSSHFAHQVSHKRGLKVLSLTASHNSSTALTIPSSKGPFPQNSRFPIPQRRMMHQPPKTRFRTTDPVLLTHGAELFDCFMNRWMVERRRIEGVTASYPAGTAEIRLWSFERGFVSQKPSCKRPKAHQQLSTNLGKRKRADPKA